MTESTWLDLQKQLQQTLSKEEFRTWFRPLRVQSEEQERLVLIAPNDRFVRTLEQSYRPVVNRAIAGLKGPQYEVLFSVAPAPANDGLRFAGPASEAFFQAPTPPPPPPPSSRPFNPRYRFQSFVVGNSNQFAYAAARAVCEGPGHTYNPLFVYGGVGLGKTHLLHAVGQELQSRNQGFRILYLSAEQFVNEFIHAIRFDRMPIFRERYRNIDALLVDDVQFLANKEGTQEEFFHTFNSLYTQQRQIILSSDCSPKQIPSLEERLQSRFAWGLIADIQPPDLETKVAILRRKAELEGTSLPGEVALFIAQQVKSNVRELEGLLNRVLAYSSLTGRPLDIDLARETLRDILPTDDPAVSIHEIVKAVARHYGLRLNEIKRRNNSRQIAFPRQVAMYLCKQLTSLSYPEIGKHFNDKHHSTVMYSVEKIEKLRVEDPDLDRTVEQIQRQLR